MNGKQVWSKRSAVVRAFVSLNTTSRLSLLLVLVLAPTGFSVGQVLQFSPGKYISCTCNACCFRPSPRLTLCVYSLSDSFLCREDNSDMLSVDSTKSDTWNFTFPLGHARETDVRNLTDFPAAFTHSWEKIQNWITDLRAWLQGGRVTLVLGLP